VSSRAVLSMACASMWLGAIAACSAGAYSSVDEIPQDPAPAGEPGHFGLGVFAHRSPFVGDGAAKTMSDLRGAMPGAPRSIKLAYAILSPSYVTLRVYRGGIDFDDWIWRDGHIDDPTPAHGTTDRDAAGVFESDDVPWAMVPTLRRRALDAAGLEGGRVSNLMVGTISGALRLSVSVHGTRHDATIVFDRNGERVP
jgi:hypothetical protein